MFINVNHQTVPQQITNSSTSLPNLRLNKTKVEKTDVDFRAEREAQDAKKRQKVKAEAKAQEAAAAEEAKRREEEKELRSYDSLFKPENMTANNCDSGEDSDDFMWNS